MQLYFAVFVMILFQITWHFAAMFAFKDFLLSLYLTYFGNCCIWQSRLLASCFWLRMKSHSKLQQNTEKLEIGKLKFMYYCPLYFILLNNCTLSFNVQGSMRNRMMVLILSILKSIWLRVFKRNWFASLPW